MTKLLKEIRDLLKEILAELKEPTAVTVDSEKFVDEFSKHINGDIGLENKRALTDASERIQKATSQLRQF